MSYFLKRTVSEVYDTVTNEEYVKYRIMADKFPHLFVGTTL